MIEWFVAALCALIAVWALSRASYWKWMWEGERSLNKILMGTRHESELPSTELWANGTYDETEAPTETRQPG
jgi:hypothetical protein